MNYQANEEDEALPVPIQAKNLDIQPLTDTAQDLAASIQEMDVDETQQEEEQLQKEASGPNIQFTAAD